MDPLSDVLDVFRLSAGLFYSGRLCSVVSLGGDGDPGSGAGLGQFHILTGGRMDVLVPGHGHYRFDTPGLLCFPRPLQHRFEPDAEQPPELACASVRFGLDADNPLARALPDVLWLPAGELGATAALIGCLRDETRCELPGRVASVNRLFEVLLLRVMRQMIAESRLDTGLLAALSDRQLSRALAAIHVKPEQPWTVEGMAVAAAMSRPRFAARFHEVMGQTPAHYLASWRIGLAQRWLLQGKPMDWIAGQVGYDSASALARAFRRHVGQAPRQWLVAKANAGLA